MNTGDQHRREKNWFNPETKIVAIRPMNHLMAANEREWILEDDIHSHPESIHRYVWIIYTRN